MVQFAFDLKEIEFMGYLRPSRTLASLSILLGIAVSFASAQSNALIQPEVAKDQSPLQRFIFGESVGASLVTGNTSQTTTTGMSLIVSAGPRVSHRWAYPVDLILSFDGIPQPILQQEGQPNGGIDLLAFALDPEFFLANSSRWEAYATGGGGISFKRVVFMRPCSVCTNSYGNYATVASESSWQPAVDAGVGGTYRIHPDGIFQLFQEARYLYMFTPRGQFPGFNTAGTGLVLLTFGFRL